MLTTLISLFSLFGLFALLAVVSFVAYQLVQQDNKAVKVPIRVERHDSRHRR